MVFTLAQNLRLALALFLFQLSPLRPQLLVLGALLVISVDHLLVELPLLLAQHALGPLQVFRLFASLLVQRLLGVLLGLGLGLGLCLDRSARQLGLELLLPGVCF